MTINIRTDSYLCQELIVPFLPATIELMVTKDEKQAFSNRFNAILDKAGIPPKGKGRQGVLAKIFGVSDKGARKWIEGESIPSTTKLPSIVDKFKATGVTVEWLLTGNSAYSPDRITGELSAAGQGAGARGAGLSNAEWLGGFDVWDSDTPLGDDEVALPFFREVRLSAGGGSSEVQENHGCKLRFAKSTLKKKDVQAEHAYCVTVKGNSMAPVLPDGCTVGIDTSKTEVANGDWYAIDHAGELRVKLVYRQPGGGYRLRSFNMDEWPDEPVRAEDIRVLGRVFWWSGLR